MPHRKPSRPPPGPRNSLEEAFFLAEDQRLMKTYRELQQARESKRSLAEVSGISDDAVLEKLVSLNVTPQSLAALAIVPLIEVAWADEHLDLKERRAILDRLKDSGVAPGGAEGKLVESWLDHRPGKELLQAWQEYVRGLCERMADTERAALRDEVLGRARSVAEASGGVGGFWKISRSEREMIERLEAAFG